MSIGLNPNISAWARWFYTTHESTLGAL